MHPHEQEEGADHHTGSGVGGRKVKECYHFISPGRMVLSLLLVFPCPIVDSRKRRRARPQVGGVKGFSTHMQLTLKLSCARLDNEINMYPMNWRQVGRLCLGKRPEMETRGMRLHWLHSLDRYR